jgi:hypothetical protein
VVPAVTSHIIIEADLVTLVAVVLLDTHKVERMHSTTLKILLLVVVVQESIIDHTQEDLGKQVSS